MEIRLQKALADAGVASRRASEKLIESGKIKVNGEVVTAQGIKVDPTKDRIEYMGKVINEKGELKYYMLNKPVRVITSAKDEKGRKTVVDIMNSKERIFPVGRLDFLTSGLLLLTNDGDLTYRITHPKHHVNKKYVAVVSPKVTKEQIDILREGATLEQYKTSPCQIRLMKEDHESQTYEVIIHEGKNRQIRNMFEYIQTKIMKLTRVQVGELTLNGLKVGTYRELTGEEIRYLKSL